jgi:hypothetical protein
VNEDGNADDMLFNPSSKFFNETQTVSIFGGKHNIYVHRTTYDEGQGLSDSLTWVGGSRPGSTVYREIMKNVIYLYRPYLAPGVALESLENGIIPTETKVKIRVTNRYINNIVTNENLGFPKYTFTTDGLAATVNDVATAESALDLINVVPNPYYAFSGYENSPVDNRIKITNLPATCVVSIYMMDGTLVRRFDRAVPQDNTDGAVLSTRANNLDTSVEWDLKNQRAVPIASGIYLIHIDAGDLGERTIKWFGITRPIDLDTF